MRQFFIIAMVLGILSSYGYANEKTCYTLSKDGESFSNTPEELCLKPGQENEPYSITLESGLPFNGKVVATFTLDRLDNKGDFGTGQNSIRNVQVFGLSNPENSIFNELKIKFDGNVMTTESPKDSGKVSIGQTTFFYRLD